MDRLIDDIHEIIKDYRIEDGIGISKDHIKTWINQFDENDREFILNELKLIFQKRYISKGRAQKIVREMISFLAKFEEYISPQEFLKECNFIDHQPEGKSQKILLSFLDEITIKEFGISIKECNSPNAKFYVYFDDILCTGDTLVKGIGMQKKGWFFQKHSNGKTNLEVFFESKAKFIWAYFAIHKYGIEKAMRRLYHPAGKRHSPVHYAWEKEFAIDNDFDRVGSNLEFLYPLESSKNEKIENCEKHIEDKITNFCESHEYPIPKKRFYRQEGLPKEETLFSSPENRIRFEKVMLVKCIEVYNSAENDNVRMRPLGYGLKTEMNFGFGALIFSWRNVPFNVPMIFWYQHRGWKPLFERKFVTYSGESASLLEEGE